MCHNFIDDYVEYGINKYKFICLDNNMKCAMERKIPFVTVILNDFNVINYAKWKLELSRKGVCEFKFFFDETLSYWFGIIE